MNGILERDVYVLKDVSSFVCSLTWCLKALLSEVVYLKRKGSGMSVRRDIYRHFKWLVNVLTTFEGFDSSLALWFWLFGLQCFVNAAAINIAVSECSSEQTLQSVTVGSAWHVWPPRLNAHSTRRLSISVSLEETLSVRASTLARWTWKHKVFSRCYRRAFKVKLAGFCHLEDNITMENWDEALFVFPALPQYKLDPLLLFGFIFQKLILHNFSADNQFPQNLSWLVFVWTFILRLELTCPSPGVSFFWDLSYRLQKADRLSSSVCRTLCRNTARNADHLIDSLFSEKWKNIILLNVPLLWDTELNKRTLRLFSLLQYISITERVFRISKCWGSLSSTAWAIRKTVSALYSSTSKG